MFDKDIDIPQGRHNQVSSVKVHDFTNLVYFELSLVW